MNNYVSTLNQISRTPVEERIVEHLSSIQAIHKLKDLKETYDYIIDNWFIYDPFWLQIVRHMHENGRLQ